MLACSKFNLKGSKRNYICTRPTSFEWERVNAAHTRWLLENSTERPSDPSVKDVNTHIVLEFEHVSRSIRTLGDETVLIDGSVLSGYYVLLARCSFAVMPSVS